MLILIVFQPVLHLSLNAFTIVDRSMPFVLNFKNMVSLPKVFHTTSDILPPITQFIVQTAYPRGSQGAAANPSYH